MPLYDLMLLLDPTAPSDRHEAILEEAHAIVESGGSIVGEQDWGTRRMTFEIDHRPEAAYHLIQFETETAAQLLDRLDHSLKIMDGVLRHRIIRLKPGTPLPPIPRPEGGRREEGAEVREGDGGAPDQAGAAGRTPVPASPAEESPLPAEEAEPAAAPATDQETGPAGGGGDDEAPSGPTAA
jgi:small subunit ribosomal protein S6